MMHNPVRVGIIGCGNVATAYQYHLHLLIGQGLVEVTYACDSNLTLARSFCHKYHIPRWTDQVSQIIDSNIVDLILVLTSMQSHADLARRILLAGKHVLVEKPLAITMVEAEDLLTVAHDSGGYLMCAPFVALSPTYQIISSRLRHGDIGQVLSARARYGHSGPTWGPWYYQNSGGAIFDLAPYNLTSLAGLIGSVKRVTAFSGTAVPERLVDGERIQVETEDNCHILLDFGASIFAVVTVGFTLQQYRAPAIELYGAQGVIQMLGDDWDPEGYELFQNSVGAWIIYKESDPDWLWTDGLRHLVDCMIQQKPPLIKPEHAYHVLEIMIRAKESAKDGQVKTVLSDFPPLKFEREIAEPEAVHLIHDRTHQRSQ